MSWYNQWAPIIASAGNSPENIVQTLVGVLGGCKPMRTDQPVTIDYPSGTALNVHGNTFVSGNLAVGPGLNLGQSSGNTGPGGNGQQPIFQVRDPDTGQQIFVVWQDRVDINLPIRQLLPYTLFSANAETNDTTGFTDEHGTLETFSGDTHSQGGTYAYRYNAGDPGFNTSGTLYYVFASSGLLDIREIVTASHGSAAWETIKRMIDDESIRARYEVWFKTSVGTPINNCRFSVEAYDENQDSMGSAEYIIGDPSTWTFQRSGALISPGYIGPGCRYVKVGFGFVYDSALDSPDDVAFDDIKLILYSD